MPQESSIRSEAKASNSSVPDETSGELTPHVTRLRIEQVSPGEIIDDPSPRVSWMLTDGSPTFQQQHYEVEFSTGTQVLHRVIHSGDSVLTAWPFDALESRQSGTVRVRVGAGDGRWTQWSDTCPLVMGLLHESDWTARFVSPHTLGGMDDGAPHVFAPFTIDDAPVAARLNITAHGIYEPFINGVRVGDDIFAPGWTAYEKRLRYQSYDVTELINAGENILGAILGNGWYRGQLVWKDNRGSYGDRLALLAQLELEFADGSRQTIGTDESWRASATGILFDDFYDGELRDLRLSNAPAPESAEGVDEVDGDYAALVARRGPAVRVTERVPAVAISRSPSGLLQVDFGQNLVGWAELTVRNRNSGDEVVVRHAEVLEAGELARRPLRSAKATATYILEGEKQETLRPTFTFNGFRYIDIQGIDEGDLVSVEAIVLGTDLERTGWFTTSDSRLNRLHENVVWGARGNFLDLPTDCPQRDERLGWTGDIQLFSPTAHYLFDTSGFLAGWLEDLAAEQFADGSVPHIIPDVLRDDMGTSTGWGDAAVVVPMTLHQAFADRGVLERQYSSMCGWIDKITTLTEPDHVWIAENQFGDWLDPTAPPNAPAQVQADPTVVATAYYARSTQLLANAATELGYVEDAHKYNTLAAGIRAGFEARFVAADGVVTSDCQTVYALALCGDLISDRVLRERAGNRLAELVIAAGYTVATGLLGTAVILDALVIAGRTDVAFGMLTETRIPSWLYAIEMGATTVWERWDSMLPDGAVNPGEMTSFNHYANGAVADWMHRRIGGLAPLEPGYRRFEVKPVACSLLDNSSTTHISPYGPIEVSWARTGDSVALDVHVPFGTTAQVWVPGADSPVAVGPGAHAWIGAV